MRAGRIALRRSCSAQNAYNPSVALFSAFCPPLTRNHAVPATDKAFATYRRVHRQRAHVRQQPVTYFSTRVCVKQVSVLATPSIQAVLDEDSQRLVERRDNYGNYEVVKNSLGRNDTIEQGAEAVETNSQRESSSPVRKIKWEGSPRQNRRFEEAIGQKRDESSKKNRYSWQAHMTKIAKDAGILSKKKVHLSDTATIEANQKQLAYFGMYIDAQPSPMHHPMPVPWALDLTSSSGKTGSDLLEQEINRFVGHMESTPAEKVARETVISELMSFIAEYTGPDVVSELFGSERTGLALATSDIDIRLDCDFQDDVGKWQYLVTKMKDLTSAMVESEEYILVVSRWVKYPIINAQHKKSGIHIQIVAAPSSAPQDALTLQYVNELPHLRALYILLRVTFGTRGLVDVFSGGPDSYGLFMMLVASIKRRSSNPPVTLTEQLFRFLDFYSTLNREKYGVSVSPPKLFKKHSPQDVPTKQFVKSARRRGDLVRSGQWAISQRRLYQPYLLCLQDPANPLNDLGRKSNAIKHVKATLNGIRADLKIDMHRAAVAAASKKGPRKGETILLGLVGRCHEVDYERRKKVEEYGLEVMALRKQAMESAEVEIPARKGAKAAV